MILTKTGYSKRHGLVQFLHVNIDCYIYLNAMGRLWVLHVDPIAVTKTFMSGEWQCKTYGQVEVIS